MSLKKIKFFSDLTEKQEKEYLLTALTQSVSIDEILNHASETYEKLMGKKRGKRTSKKSSTKRNPSRATKGTKKRAKKKRSKNKAT